MMRLGLRAKLLLSALPILALPWAGYRFLSATEASIGAAQDRQMLGLAQAVALAVASQGVAGLDTEPASPAYPHPNIQVHRLTQPPLLDGAADDWERLLPLAVSYPMTGQRTWQLLYGEDDDAGYLLLRLPSIPSATHYLELVLETRFGQLKQYRLGLDIPGTPIAAEPLPSPPEGGIPDSRIRAIWQPGEQGATIEIRIAGELAADGLALTLANTPAPIIEASSSDPGHPGRLVRTIPLLQEMLDQLRPPAEAVRVTERNGLPAAGLGDDELIPQRPAALNAALGGRPQVDRLNSASGLPYLLAGYPVAIAGETFGAVLLTQPAQTLTSIEDEALRTLARLTLAVFLLAVLGLLLYAGLLVRRVSRLQQQAERAVGPDGRLLQRFEPGSTQDELGSLARAFAGLLQRLGGYHSYLEALASRLAHELRTPLAVVRTSLDASSGLTSLQQAEPYLQRAREGAARLEGILSRLREATRLEQGLAGAEHSPFDLRNLCEANLAAFRTLHPDIRFELEAPGSFPCHGSPELMTQALEKLLGNAVDFHRTGTSILLRCRQETDGSWIWVENQGPLLPEGVDPFGAMVSVRQKRDETPHLGLGLHLVRLIAEQQGGVVSAQNLPDASGVRIGFRIHCRPPARRPR